MVLDKFNIKKVLVAGWVGSENLGDEAILSSIVSRLKAYNIEISAFSKRPGATHSLHGITAVPFDIFTNPYLFLKTIANTDLMIIGGGGILQDQTSIFNTPRYLYKAVLGHVFRKKVVYLGVGVGPIKYRLTKILIKIVLNLSDGITVRDEASKNLLISIGVKSTSVKTTFDPVINLEALDLVKSKKILDSEIRNPDNKQIIGVSLRHWYDTNPLLTVELAQKLHFKNANGKEKYELLVDRIAESLNTLIEKDQYIIFFIPFWYTRDTQVHNDIIKKIKNTTDVYSLKKEYSPKDLLGVYRFIDLAIAMRLHASIFAATAGKPFITLSYSSKTSSFVENMNLEMFSQNIDDLKPNQLSSDSIQLLNNKTINKDLIERGNGFKETEKENIKLVTDALGITKD